MSEYASDIQSLDFSKRSASSTVVGDEPLLVIAEEKIVLSPEDVDELTESNDLAVLRSQMSSDELVNDEDIENTDKLIEQGRLEDQEEYSSDSDESKVSSLDMLTSFRSAMWQTFTKSAINLVLPFINGMMLGFGEIVAHEIGFKYNWVGARVSPPRRMVQKSKKNESQFL